MEKTEEGACVAMERRIIVSGGEGLRVFSLPDGALLRRMRLKGSGALCCARNMVYCACGTDGRIVGLDAGTLDIKAAFAGGPGICGMCVLGDRLYALCGEGDGVLMLDAKDGSPLVFARAGQAPMQLKGDEERRVLAVAGGGDGRVTLLCAESMHSLGSEEMPGPVYSVVLLHGRIHALCLSETLDALLVTIRPEGGRHTLMLHGLPGVLAAQGDALLAAVQGGIYRISADGKRILAFIPAGGYGRWMAAAGNQLLCLDAAGERLWAIGGGRRLLICGDAADAALVDV